MSSPRLADGQEVTVVLRGRVASQYQSFVAGPTGKDEMVEVKHTGGISACVPQNSPDVDILEGHVTARDLRQMPGVVTQ